MKDKMISKKSLRSEIKQRKAALSSAEKEQQSEAVWQYVERLNCFTSAQHILLYHSLPDELSTHSTISRWLAMGKTVYLPVVIGNELVIRQYNKDFMQQGEFNIWEPTGNDIDPLMMQLIIVPGVGYDNKGNRLGRGKGYYDRLLAHTQAPTIGVCYSCQYVDTIPSEPHDQVIDYIITPQGIMKQPKQAL